MVADFRMRLIYAAVDLSIENKAGSNSGSDGYVNQSALILASTPACFSKSSSVGIVLHRHFHLKGSAQIADRILSFPMGKEVDLADLAGQRIHRSSGSDPNTGDLGVCGLRGGS